MQFDIRLFAHRGDNFFQVLLILIGRRICLLNAIHDRTLGGNYGFDVEASHELDVVHCKDIRWIHHRDGERSTYSAERKYLVFAGGFLRDESYDVGIDFKELQIDCGNTVLAT